MYWFDEVYIDEQAHELSLESIFKSRRRDDDVFLFIIDSDEKPMYIQESLRSLFHALPGEQKLSLFHGLMDEILQRKKKLIQKWMIEVYPLLVAECKLVEKALQSIGIACVFNGRQLTFPQQDWIVPLRLHFQTIGIMRCLFYLDPEKKFNSKTEKNILKQIQAIQTQSEARISDLQLWYL